ncbi:MAG TPA: hypothetical protein VLC52_04435 [Anaerolineae bacterium]|nr:hypothetical protein [Anaerolineae bacterium]
MRRLVAAVLILDGLVTAVWGHGFIAWQRSFAPAWLQKAVLEPLLRWPEPLLRLGAAGQAVLGGLLFFLRS